ncbi:MAG: hypothetical protein Q8876_00575 [Bacillota bacterium]|nr:hypothetical protein [Bacillota bacterium]
MFKKSLGIILAIALVATMTCIASVTAFATVDTTKIYTVAGAQGLCEASDPTSTGWKPADAANNMATIDASSLYASYVPADQIVKVFTNVAAGSYDFKITTNNAWDNGEYNLTGDASFGGANATVVVANTGDTVVIGFDGTKAYIDYNGPALGATVAPTEVVTDAPTDATVAPTDATVAPTDATVAPTEVATEVPTQTTTVPADASTATVKTGDTVTFTVHLTAGTADAPVVAIDDAIDFSNTTLQFVSASFPNLSGVVGGTTANATDDANVSELNFNASVLAGFPAFAAAGGADVAVVTFNVIADGQCWANSNMDSCYDVNFNDFVVNNVATNGAVLSQKIDVKAAPTTPTEPTIPTEPTTPTTVTPTDATVAPTTIATDATTVATVAPTTAATTATPGGSVTTGQATSVTVLFVVLMLAAGVVLFARKRRVND